MVRIQARGKRPPDGFTEIEEVLLEFENKMREAEASKSEDARDTKPMHRIFQIHHQRSRYIYDLYYSREAISTELYNWLLKQGYGDPKLIAKWKKQGYEKLCCLKCIAHNETNFNSTCICRVPKYKLEKNQDVKCVHCGCHGCASSD